MNEIARLAVGTLLLGLAIFLSLNFEEQSGAALTEEVASLAEPTQAATEMQPIGQPTWQAEPASGQANWLTEQKPTEASDRSGEAVRPRFDDQHNNIFARPLNSSRPNPPVLGQPPRIADQYQPTRPLLVAGQVRPTGNLVPVQPKPTFTGKISVVRQIHVIRSGDTLQSISRQYFGSADRYLDIYLLNKDVLSNPAGLPEGVEIRIPGE